MTPLNPAQLPCRLFRNTVVRLNWVMENTIESHLVRIKGHLATGREVLRSLRKDELIPYDVPDVTPDLTITESAPPQDADP